MNSLNDIKIYDKDLAILLFSLVYTEPGLTGRQYAAILRNQGNEYDKTSINSCLTHNPAMFDDNRDERSIPAWTINHDFMELLQNVLYTMSEISSVEENVFQLRSWQKEAKSKWESNGYKGIIEAVKLSGKKTLALSIIIDHLNQGYRVVVLANTRSKLEEWIIYFNTILEKVNSKISVGKMGDGSLDTLETHNIIFGTIHSARNYKLGLPKGKKGLIIVDECQLCATYTNCRSLEDDFERRLGLSSVLARTDNGIELYLEPYFNSVVYKYPIVHAFVNNHVDAVDINFVRLDMDYVEREQYEYNSALLDLIHEARSIDERKEIHNEYDWSKFQTLGKLIIKAKAKTDYLISKFDDLKKYDKSIIFVEEQFMINTVTTILSVSGISYIDVSEARGETFLELLDTYKKSSSKILLTTHISNAFMYDFNRFQYCLILGSNNDSGRLSQKLACLVQPFSASEPIKVDVLCIKETYEDPIKGAYPDYWEYYEPKKPMPIIIYETRPKVKQETIKNVQQDDETILLEKIFSSENLPIDNQNHEEFVYTHIIPIKQIEKESTIEDVYDEIPNFRIPDNMEKARITVIGTLGGKKNEYYLAAKKIGIDFTEMDFYDYELDGFDISQAIKSSTSDVIIGPNQHSNEIDDYFKLGRRNLPKEIHTLQIRKDRCMSLSGFKKALTQTYKYHYISQKQRIIDSH